MKVGKQEVLPEILPFLLSQSRNTELIISLNKTIASILLGLYTCFSPYLIPTNSYLHCQQIALVFETSSQLSLNSSMAPSYTFSENVTMYSIKTINYLLIAGLFMCHYFPALEWKLVSHCKPGNQSSKRSMEGFYELKYS